MIFFLKSVHSETLFFVKFFFSVHIVGSISVSSSSFSVDNVTSSYNSSFVNTSRCSSICSFSSSTERNGRENALFKLNEIARADSFGSWWRTIIQYLCKFKKNNVSMYNGYSDIITTSIAFLQVYFIIITLNQLNDVRCNPLLSGARCNRQIRIYVFLTPSFPLPRISCAKVVKKLFVKLWNSSLTSRPVIYTLQI